MALSPAAEGPPEETIKPIGCEHYKRKSKFVVSFFFFFSIVNAPRKVDVYL